MLRTRSAWVRSRLLAGRKRQPYLPSLLIVYNTTAVHGTLQPYPTTGTCATCSSCILYIPSQPVTALGTPTSAHQRAPCTNVCRYATCTTGPPRCSPAVNIQHCAAKSSTDVHPQPRHTRPHLCPAQACPHPTTPACLPFTAAGSWARTAPPGHSWRHTWAGS